MTTEQVIEALGKGENEMSKELTIGVFRIVNDGSRNYAYTVLHECGLGFGVWFKRRRDAKEFINEILKTHSFKNAEKLKTLSPDSKLGKKLRVAVNKAADSLGAIR